MPIELKVVRTRSATRNAYTRMPFRFGVITRRGAAPDPSRPRSRSRWPTPAEMLEQYLERDGILFLKIKVGGALAADLARLEAVAAV